MRENGWKFDNVCRREIGSTQDYREDNKQEKM